MRWCAVAPGSQYFGKIDIGVQLFVRGEGGGGGGG